MNPTCPHCGSTNLEDTEECTVYPHEIQQDFKCIDCGGTCLITFAPIAVKPLEKPQPEEE